MVITVNEGRIRLDGFQTTAAEIEALRSALSIPDLTQSVYWDGTRLLWGGSQIRPAHPDYGPLSDFITAIENDSRLVDDIKAYRAAQAPEPETPTRWNVPTGIVQERLASAGVWQAAKAAMEGGTMASGLNAWDRWIAVSVIYSDDAEVRAMIAAIGADPDVILAAE